MLTKEQNQLLSIIKDFICNTDTVLPDDIDTAALAKTAKKQQVDSIISYQTHIPELDSSMAFVSYCVVNREKAMNDIHTAFQKNSIKYMTFKGKDIAKYYPVTHLRQMGDIDILVKSEDIEKATTILFNLGFESENAYTNKYERVFTKNNLEIELHYRLLYDSHLNEENLVAFSDKVWDYSKSDDGINYHIDPQFHLIFLLLHLRKHLLWAGTSIRQFLDIALIEKNETNIDWINIEETLRDLDLLDFSKTVFALINRWFDIDCPIQIENLSNDFYESATEMVLGFDAIYFKEKIKDEMIDNEIISSIRHNNTFFGKLKMMLYVAFPPYANMKRKYPKMGKCPLLLPIMWIRRMIESIIQKTAKDRATYVLKPLTLSEKTKQREEFLKQWGLQ